MTQRNFEISVAGWSYHREIWSGRLQSIDAFERVREELGLGAFELVNTLLEVPTARYVDRLAAASASHQVEVPLILCDGEGDLGASDADDRSRAIRNHTKWIWIAADLGCRAIRVNWKGVTQAELEGGIFDDFIHRSVASLHELLEISQRFEVDIVVENHGGPSSDPDLLVRLMEAVDAPGFGSLPDFGNFPPDTDRYAAVEAMMPWAKAVSAKCYDFADDGKETTIDFERMLEICIDKYHYRGFIGIEYEGERLSESAGTMACRDLLRRLRG